MRDIYAPFFKVFLLIHVYLQNRKESLKSVFFWVLRKASQNGLSADVSCILQITSNAICPGYMELVKFDAREITGGNHCLYTFGEDVVVHDESYRDSVIRPNDFISHYRSMLTHHVCEIFITVSSAW